MLPRTFVQWFSYYGMRAGMREALESRHWTEDMINAFIANFREKHGFNRHTAMLPYWDEDDSKEEPINLEGGRKAVLRRRIISPKESPTQEEGDDKLDDLVTKPRKRKAANPGEGTGQTDPPAKKQKKEKKVKQKAAKPKKTATKPKKAGKPKPKKKKAKKAKKEGEDDPKPMGEGEPRPGAMPGGESRPSADPLHPQPGDTPALHPEADPDPLGTEPQIANVGEIPLPPGTPPARPLPGSEPEPTPQLQSKPGREPMPPPPLSPRREPTPPPSPVPTPQPDPEPRREPTPPHLPSPQRQVTPPRQPSPQRQTTPPRLLSPQRQVTLPRPQPSPQRQNTPPRQPSPQREPTPPPGNTMPQRDTPPGDSDPSPQLQREPGDGDSQNEGGGDPGNQGGGGGSDDDDDPSSPSGNGSGDGDSNTPMGSRHSSCENDDSESEDEHSNRGMGAGSMPTGQDDDHTGDQSSQLSSSPIKGLGKKLIPKKPPAKPRGRKQKAPRRKFPMHLQADAQYTGPCVRTAMRYPTVNRKKPILYVYPIHKKVGKKEGLQNVGYSNASWDRAHAARRQGRLVKVGRFRPGTMAL